MNTPELVGLAVTLSLTHGSTKGLTLGFGFPEKKTGTGNTWTTRQPQHTLS